MDEHTVAVGARLDAGEHLTVYDGPRLPTDLVREGPHVTFYVYVPDEHPTKLNRAVTDEFWVTITTHSIAGTLSDARLVRKRVGVQLRDWLPVVAGWVCHRVRRDTGDPEDWTTETGEMRYDLVDVWSYRCAPIG